MSNLQRYAPSTSVATRRVGRTVSRELTTIQAISNVRLAQLQSEAEVQAATADAVAFVGRKALQDVALLSSVETQLATAVPHASGRLAAIADLTAIALAEVVADTARAIRQA